MSHASAQRPPQSSTRRSRGRRTEAWVERQATSVFIEGKKVATLRGTGVADQFKVMVAEYIEQGFGGGRAAVE